MKVNFFCTCIGDAVKSRAAAASVLLLEKLGCEIVFPKRQSCCGQPAINSGWIREAIPGMKNNIATFEPESRLLITESCNSQISAI